LSYGIGSDNHHQKTPCGGLLNEEHLIERVMYKLVKKYISGTTMNSAIERTKELNKNGLTASITFLTENPADKSKASYITSTYQELERKISRLGLKASIQVDAVQIGMDISEETMLSNFSKIVEIGNRYGVFVWLKIDNYSENFPFQKYGKGVGLAIPQSLMYEAAQQHSAKALKIIFSKEESKNIKVRKGTFSSFMQKYSGAANHIVLSYLPCSILDYIPKNQQQCGNTVFEFDLSNQKKVSKRAASKRAANISITVPFGKDWVPYAVNNAPERYIRFLTSRMLGDQGGSSS
jgi:proline dehydrogenase